MKSYIVVIAALAFPATVCCQSVEVTYQAKHTAVSVAEMPHTDVSAKGHDGVQHTFSCVSLGAVLAKVQTPAGENLRGAAMSLVVIAGAKDNYHATFALAELDDSIGNKLAFVCDKQDGKPLSQSEGPLRLVVPADKRPARWVRMLTSLEVEQVKP